MNALASRHRAGEGLTPLHPDHVKVLRIEAAILSVVLLVAASALEIAVRAGELPIPGFTFFAIWLVVAIVLVWRVPMRRWSFKGYAVDQERLRTVRGFLWRQDTIVPFSRVQHIDVTQGPLERLFDLATLVVHTAGTHNASVPLEGIKRDRAEAMRDSIRAHIKREAA